MRDPSRNETLMPKTKSKPKARVPPPSSRTQSNRPKLDAPPDTIDFRDQMYIATLTEVPTERPLADYKKVGVPILNQGTAGACAGFGLATVANYLLRKRKIWPAKTGVSPWMLYAMAQVSDPRDESAAYGQAVNPDVGASCRSAMKGWNQNGVCQANYFAQSGACKQASQVVVDARLRPLGAYFRVNHKDLVAMHTAIQEVGILYVSGLIHEGWFAAGKDVSVNPILGKTVVNGIRRIRAQYSAGTLSSTIGACGKETTVNFFSPPGTIISGTAIPRLSPRLRKS
jgi:hypothetical protein